MPKKYHQIILKEQEYEKLVAIAKKKGYSQIAQYVYSMLDEEVKKMGMTREELLRLIEDMKYGKEYHDYW